MEISIFRLWQVLPGITLSRAETGKYRKLVSPFTFDGLKNGPGYQIVTNGTQVNHIPDIQTLLVVSTLSQKYFLRIRQPSIAITSRQAASLGQLRHGCPVLEGWQGG